jgi:2-polyprenyl-3-methyl-5-hydroxy-6-metoxy-1,4-benzoquinol methylase
MKKIYNFDPDSYNTHMLLVNEVLAGSKVLEIGTASGYLGDYLASKKKCEVWGVEPVRELYDEAANSTYKKILNQTAEDFIIYNQNNKETFDVILLGDVLEHMSRPDQVLIGLKEFLKPDGKFVISMPNIAHYSIRISLLCGKWNMADSGILDRTHLRFFTLFSARKMIEDCGLEIEKVRPSAGYIERFGLNKLVRIGQRLLFMWPELLAVQFIFIARSKK